MPLFSDIETQDTEKQFDDGCVGQIRIGGAKNGVPFTTETIRVTADLEETLTELAKKLGGDPVEWETNKSDRYEILTDTNSVEVECHEWDGYFERWHEKKRVNHCDGKQQFNGDACECPFSAEEKKEQARQGKACKPKFKAKVSFPDKPELGKFRFESGSWNLLRKSNAIEEHIADGPAPIEIAIADFTNKKGQLVRFPKVSTK